MKVDIEKAIEEFKRLKYVSKDLKVEHIGLAISALEKQLPKKPTVRCDNEFTDADGNRGMCIRHIECPNCESEIFVQFEYCPECGQRLEGVE